MTPGLVVLTSGGFDSALLLHMAKRMNYNPIALLIDYGQKHVRELDAAVKLCDDLQVPFKRMKVDLAQAVDSGLTGTLQGGKYAGLHEMHVPGRNTIFVGLALSLAEAVGATKIWYGANFEDRINEFADCKQDWVLEMNKSLKIAGSYPVELEAPLLGMRKDTIVRMGKLYHDIKEEEVHSGYAV